MNHKLSSNIRALRKERKLTQEQLAEAMNVTVGAVSKWELGQSLPEINMLINLADFFDTSIDSLLDYEIHSTNEEQLAKYLKSFRDDKHFEDGKAEFEKAYKKYPNSFQIVFQGAKLYHLHGIETRDKQALQRGIILLNRAITLIDQNTDPEISIVTLKNHVAESYMSLGESEKALELFKANNPHGINDSLIGMVYATTDRPDEALKHLSIAFLSSLCEQVRITVGYVNAFGNKEDFASAIEILNWQEQIFPALKSTNQTFCFEKTEAVLFTASAMMYYYDGKEKQAREYLIKAKNAAEHFDASPVYNCDGLKFYYGDKPSTIYDDLGETAMHSIEKALREEEGCQGLIDIWKEVLSNEETVYKTIL